MVSLRPAHIDIVGALQERRSYRYEPGAQRSDLSINPVEFGHRHDMPRIAVIAAQTYAIRALRVECPNSSIRLAYFRQHLGLGTGPFRPPLVPFENEGGPF